MFLEDQAQKVETAQRHRKKTDFEVKLDLAQSSLYFYPLQTKEQILPFLPPLPLPPNWPTESSEQLDPSFFTSVSSSTEMRMTALPGPCSVPLQFPFYSLCPKHSFLCPIFLHSYTHGKPPLITSWPRVHWFVGLLPASLHGKISSRGSNIFCSLI